MLALALPWGCAVPPAEPEAPAGEPPPLPKSTPAAHSDYEQRQRDRAGTLLRQGRLADAALTWEILTVLRPDLPEYAEQLTRTRRQIEAAANDRLQRAVQAQKRGELDAATQLYLSVLALQPDQAQAADALRAMERDRNKRSYLGKFARITLTQRPATAARPAAAEAAAAAPSQDRNELEHAAMLTVQGEFDDAIALLERRLASGRPDEVARSLLADAYFQKAEQIAAGDRAGAIAALEKSVRLYAAHPLAAARLKQLKAPAGGAAAPAAPAASAPSRAAVKGGARASKRNDTAEGGDKPQ
jgi:predicted Zn-dependent protease